MEQTSSKIRYELLALIARLEGSGKPGPQKIYPQMLSESNFFDLSYHLKWMAEKQLVSFKRHLVGATFSVTLLPAGRELVDLANSALQLEGEERTKRIGKILDALN